MKNLYEVAKRVGKKALLGGLTAGSMYLAGCSGNSENPCDFPVTQEARQAIDSNYASVRSGLEKRFANYDAIEDSATAQFNRAIEDRHFSKEEQKQVYATLKTARDSLSVISHDADSLNVSEYAGRTPNKNKALYAGLYENINGVDWGTPELEKELRSCGYDVGVDESESDVDAVPMYIAMVFVTVGIGQYLAARDERRFEVK